MRILFAVLVGCCALAFSGCADQTDQVEDTDRVCEEASQHLVQCGQSTDDLFPDGCNVELAEELLAVDCSALSDPGKSDLVGSLMCRSGFYRHCKVPACRNALPSDFHDWGDCAELIDEPGCGACDYYRCREETSAGMCGDTGYYMGFGYKYCLRYRQVTEPKMSPQGQTWSAQTRRCLMETLEAEIPDSGDCEGLIEAGYNSHPECYLGTGFCELPKLDWVRIVNTIDLGDVDFALMSEVRSDCAGQ